MSSDDVKRISCTGKAPPKGKIARKRARLSVPFLCRNFKSKATGVATRCRNSRGLPSNTTLPFVTKDNRLGSPMPSNPLPRSAANFHYMCMQPRTCPFCDFDCESNDDLLEHCSRYHGMSKESGFEAAVGEEGYLRVIARVPQTWSSDKPSSHISEGFVFVESRPSASRNNAPTPFHRHSVTLLDKPRKTASLNVATHNRKTLSLQANNALLSASSAYLPNDTEPLRQYFHSRTNLPMAQGEWMEDSDDETDNSWLREMSAELLDEIEDVSVKEKTFMKMWNCFIKSDHIIADRDVPRKCHEFVLKYQEELRDGGLRLNLLLHLFNLWDSGVVSENRILSCMTIFDAFPGNSDCNLK